MGALKLRTIVLVLCIWGLSSSALGAAQRVELDIPSSRLSEALLALGRQARISIVFAKEATQQLSAPALKGRYKPREALTKLIDENCLSFRFLRPSLVVLKAGCSTKRPASQKLSTGTKRAEQPDGRPLEELVVTGQTVTGTRLRGERPFLSLPVDVIDRWDIELSGHQAVGDVLRYVPAVSGNSTSTLVTNGGDGSASVTLRGLPASNTLILLNGRRLNSDALTGASVDLNTLPLALVDRIEIVKDGASAIYGSDAIAGVVNVITSDNVEGLHVDAFAGASDRGDLDTESGSLLWGWQSNHFSVQVGLAHYQREPLFSRNRDLSSTSDDRSRGGIDNRSSATSPARIETGAGPVILAGSNFDGSDVSQFRAATDEDRFEFRDFTTLIVPSKQSSALVNLVWHTDHLEAYLDLLFNYTYARNTLAPTPLFTGFESIPLVVAAEQPFNPFDEAIFDIRRRLTELGPRVQTNETFTERAVIGARGFWQSFNWDLAVQHSRTRGVQRFSGAVSGAQVQQALSSDCSAPCVPLNLFGPTIEQAQLEFISTRTRSRGRSRLNSLTLTLDGPLFALPNGPVQLASGVEFRREILDTQPDIQLLQGGVIGNANIAETRGRRTLFEAFAEAHFPLLKDLPAIYRFDAFVAGRFSRYSDFGREWNPRVVLSYQPVPALTLRTSFATGFRAPALAQLFGGQSQAFEQLNDPCAVAENVGVLPGCLTLSDPTLGQFLTQRGGERNLEPETSRNFTYGFVYRREFDNISLSVSADRYRIRQRNVVDGSAQLIVDENAMGNGFEDRVVRDANGNISRVLATFLNIGQRDVRGFDTTVTLDWKSPSYGSFRFALNATLIERFADRLSPSFPSVDQAGTFVDAAAGGNGALPDWKSSVGLQWHKGHWRSQYNLFLVSAVNEIVPQLGTERELELWGSHNFQLSYLGPVTRWLRVSVGGNNLLDEPPPFSAAAFNDSHDSRTYDITGRFLYLRLEKSF